MKIDFSKISVGTSLETIVEPRAIFAALPAKDKKFSYLRDVQAEVLDGWFKHRERKDIIIKLNTGGGKTAVALLLLKSCLNEGKGPAAYFAPDIYLARQVAQEAAQLGIRVVDEPRHRDFVQGRAILIDNIASLVNGRSVFGIKAEGIKIPLGSVVIDDAHASLERVEDQFTCVIDKQEKPGTYEKLLTLFRDSLGHQSMNGLLEIEAGDGRRVVPVPYWAWQSNLETVTKLIAGHPDKDEFVWRLINDDLRFASCVFTGTKLEISTQCLPITHIRSYEAAKRRVFLTATLARDSILTTHFGVSPDSIVSPIVPSRVDDIGDRIIVVPQQLNPTIEDEEIVAFAGNCAETWNVVVLVPSKTRATRWNSVAKLILDRESIYDGVARLKAGHVGLVVLVNKYDGVDLPDDACRLLIIDDIPSARRAVDRYSDSLLDFSDDLVGRRVQRIEQGMGRGVRSNNDYCAVLLMGARLADVISDPRARKRFTPATATQLAISDAVVSQIATPSLSDIRSLLEFCVGRDPNWLAKSRAALANVGTPNQPKRDTIASVRRTTFDLASIDQVGEAAGAYEAVIRETSDSQTKGLLTQEMAVYRNAIDPVGAQEAQRSALQSNRYLLKAIDGISYEKLRAKSTDQAAIVIQNLSTFPTINAAVVQLNAIREDLGFLPDCAEEFERAFERVASFVGFHAQRPEKTEGRGPDVLWVLGGQTYCVIECKNGAINPNIGKRDCDQLGGSMAWFEEKYGADVKYTPLIVHPSGVFDQQAAPRPNMRVMNADCLTKFKAALAEFGKAIGAQNKKPDIASISALIDHCGFRATAFVATFTRPFKQQGT